MQNVILTLVVFLVRTFAATADAQLVVAHRGASYDAPENTLAAFRLAWDQHADAIEGDFYVTKDQQIVCIHDKTTKRIAPQQPDLSIANSTLEELQKLDAGSWKHPRYAAERIPTLKEVLGTVPEGKQIFVEIKCGPEILPLLQPQLESSGMKARTNRDHLLQPVRHHTGSKADTAVQRELAHRIQAGYKRSRMEANSGRCSGNAEAYWCHWTGNGSKSGSDRPGVCGCDSRCRISVPCLDGQRCRISEKIRWPWSNLHHNRPPRIHPKRNSAANCQITLTLQG